MRLKTSYILLFCFSIPLFHLHAQDSFEHRSVEVLKYRLEAEDNSKRRSFGFFLSRNESAIFFDFKNNRDQEYLFEQEFDQLLSELSLHLASNPGLVKVLIFNGVSKVWIDRLLSQTKLADKIYRHDINQPWPALQQVNESGKQLITFFLDDGNHSLVTGKYIPDLNSFQLSGEVTLPGQLLLLSVGMPANQNASFQLPPGFVDAFVEIWKSSGQQPNFVLLDGVSFPQNISLILNSTEKFIGSISYSATDHSPVFWSGDFDATTGSTFSFPAYAGEPASVKPQQPGYSFTPETLTIQGSEGKPLSIKAAKKPITEGVTAYYPLDKNIKDNSGNGVHGVSHQLGFFKDFNRSNVADFRQQHYGELPDVRELDLVNNSFTISTWIKLDSLDNEDQMILSSYQNKYSEGLHILSRNKKPYFAFYHNDLEGKTTLKAGQWYNIIWQYRKELQQQAIFINGELDTLAVGRPPLRGVGQLFIGYREKADGAHTYFNGFMDDIVFWNRALDASEIQNIYLGAIQIENNHFKWLLAGVLGVVFFVLGLMYFIRKKKRPATVPEDVDEKVVVDHDRNAVFMFGGLKVLDRDGNNITNEITPRLKELFILLYVSTLKSKKGISSEDLSHNIWPDHSRQSAINNRGVSTTKLRQVLSKLDGVELTYKNQFWTLTTGDQVYSDYHEYLKLVEQQEHSGAGLNRLVGILKNGEFLPNLSKEWLDPFKFDVSNQIIDVFLPRLEPEWQAKNYDVLIGYCDLISTYDVVQETAIKYKVAALRMQKKHEQALKVYQGFVSHYRQFYDEEFVVAFNDFQP